MPYLLGLDVGTTSIKAWLYDSATARAVAGASRPTPTAFPRSGWAEHDPEALWQALAASVREALDRAPPEPVAALAVASMAEAGVLLDSADRPLYPFIAYYDTRADRYVGWWHERVGPAMIHAISGQVLRPPFGVMKLLWLRDTYPDMFARARRWLSVADYAIWRLCGTAVTEPTLASRTMLFDQRTRWWSADLLQVAGLPQALFPDVVPSGAYVGGVHADASAQTGLPVGTPVAIAGHDHLCGALAAGVTQPGQVLASLGTAAALLAPAPVFHGGGAAFEQGLSCYCHVAPERYVIQGGLGAAGGAFAWLSRMVRGAAEPADFAALDAAAATSPPGARGLVCLPHLRGGGTPERDPASRAALVGLRDYHGPGDAWRALTESLAFWARRNLVEIERLTGTAAGRLTLIGGTARVRLLPQVLAAVIGRPVDLPRIDEAVALGAALLAGLSVGVAPELRAEVHTVEPDLQAAARYQRLYTEAYLPLYQALKPLNHALEAFAAEDV